MNTTAGFVSEFEGLNLSNGKSEMSFGDQLTSTTHEGQVASHEYDSDKELMQDLEKSLFSLEKLECSSPDLWPDQIQAASEYASKNCFLDDESPTLSWTEVFSDDDVNLLQYYGNLSQSKLLEEIHNLQNLAYQLGLEEAKEMTRGKYLKILDKRHK